MQQRLLVEKGRSRRTVGLAFEIPHLHVIWLLAVARISLPEADALVGKLSFERIRVHAYFKSSSGSEARMSGFVEYKTVKDGLPFGDPTARSFVHNGFTVSTSGGPSLVPGQGYLLLSPFRSTSEIWYGEKRDLPEEQKHLADKFDECALCLSFTFPDFNECFALFFTI